MREWTAESYGDEWAEDYDDRFRFVEDEGMLVAKVVSGLIGDGGNILELGAGTGRISIPLARLGVRTVGLDASQSMLDALAAKPGGDLVDAVRADFSSFELDEKFSAVLLSCNTLFSLYSQDLQVSCLACVSRHLKGDGLLIVESGMPEVFRQPQTVQPAGFTTDGATLELISHDGTTQQVHRLRISMSPSGLKFKSVFNRYVWPSELDLMAQLAGLRLHTRWAGWEKNQFTNQSTGHVSVYGPK